MKALLIQYFTPIVLTAAGGLLTSLTSMVLLKTRKWVESKTKNENIAWALERLTHTTETVVADLTKTVVANIKAEAADGKLANSDASSIKKLAISTVKYRLNEEIKAYAEMGVNNLDLFIGEKVEQAVGKLQAATVPEVIQKPAVTGFVNWIKSKLGVAVN